MITTIQIHESVKNELESLKENRESYEDVIVKLMSLLEKQKRSRDEFIIKGYKEMSKDSLKISKEFESIEKDWEW